MDAIARKIGSKQVDQPIYTPYTQGIIPLPPTTATAYYSHRLAAAESSISLAALSDKLASFSAWFLVCAFCAANLDPSFPLLAEAELASARFYPASQSSIFLQYKGSRRDIPEQL